jgi:predicted nucleic acid-binding protein
MLSRDSPHHERIAPFGDMVYIDTSCLVAFLVNEPVSGAVRAAIQKEEVAVISPLAELEAEVQFKAEVTGGRIRLAQWRQVQAQLAALRNVDPFHFITVPASLFATALRQHRRPDSLYCRTLDRLHLAAAEALEIERFMTLDQTQAKSAQSLGFKVVAPHC